MNEDEYEYLERKRKEHEEWVKQHSIKLEVGKTYIQKAQSWAIMHYKIISIEGKVALGISVYNGIWNSKTRGCGVYELFVAATGQKYQESRLNYALIEEVKEK